MAKRKEFCKDCNINLSTPLDEIGYCAACANRELSHIKKYFLISFIIGIILVAIAFLVIHFFKSHPYKGTHDYIVYGPALFMSSYSFRYIIDSISIRTQIVIYWMIFMIPFGVYIKIEDSIGIATLTTYFFEFLISAVTGPLKIIFSLVKLYRIKKITNLCNADDFQNNKNY